MKVVGLTQLQVKNVLSSTKINFTQWGKQPKNGVSGQLWVGKWDDPPSLYTTNKKWKGWGTHVKLCAHGQAVAAKILLNAGAKEVWCHKIQFKMGKMFSASIKLETKLVKRGLVAKGCPDCVKKAVEKILPQPVPKLDTKQGPVKFGMPEGTGLGDCSGETCQVCGQHWGAHHAFCCDGSHDPVSSTRQGEYNKHEESKCPKVGKIPKMAMEPKTGPTKKKKKPTYTKYPPIPTGLIEVAPLEGDPATGTTRDATILSESKARCVVVAVTGLYVLQELEQAWSRVLQVEAGAYQGRLSYMPYNPALVRQVQERMGLVRLRFPNECGENYNVRLRSLFSEFAPFKQEYEHTLARNLFDYLVMACVGEARHKGGLKWPAEKKPCERKEAWELAMNYDPRQVLPLMERVFGGLNWGGGGFGGAAWANIAKSAGYYFKFRNMPVVFADHVVDLSHNGGIAFNKGYLLRMKYPRYMEMLDTKREESLLKTSRLTELHVPEMIGYFVHRMAGVGLIDKPKPTLTEVVDKPAPLIDWGTEPLHLYWKGGDGSGPEEEEEAEEYERERYLSGRE